MARAATGRCASGTGNRTRCASVSSFRAAAALTVPWVVAGGVGGGRGGSRGLDWAQETRTSILGACRVTVIRPIACVLWLTRGARVWLGRQTSEGKRSLDLTDEVTFHSSGTGELQQVAGSATATNDIDTEHDK